MLHKLFGLPAHPVYVHFPIALFVSAGFLLALHGLDGGNHRLNQLFKKIGLGNFDFESFSFLAVVLGFGTGLVAVLSGVKLVDGWENLPVPHGFLGLATMICYFIAMVLRWVFGPSLLGRPLRIFYYGLHIIGLVLAALTGFAGGELHYS